MGSLLGTIRSYAENPSIFSKIVPRLIYIYIYRPPSPEHIYLELDCSMTDDHPPAEMPIYEQVDESFHHVHDHMYIINDQVIECHNPGYGIMA